MKKIYKLYNRENQVLATRTSQASCELQLLRIQSSSVSRAMRYEGYWIEELSVSEQIYQRVREQDPYHREQVILIDPWTPATNVWVKAYDAAGNRVRVWGHVMTGTGVPGTFHEVMRIGIDSVNFGIDKLDSTESPA